MELDEQRGKNITMINDNDEFGCNDYSAFYDLKPGQTILKVPCRSPLVVVEKIKPYIKNKVVCELGSAVGDFALEMAKYAKKVIGVELDEERVFISRKRGLYTIYADASALPPLPEKIDVYYMWMHDGLTRQVFNSIKDGLIIMAGELGYGSETGYVRGVELKVLDEIRAEYPQSRMFEVKYREGNGERQFGRLSLLVVKKIAKKMKNLMIYFNPEKKFLAEAESLVKRQIDNSLKQGWKKADIVLLTNFPYKYQGIKAIVVDENLFCNINDKAIKANAIFRLLEQKVVKEAQLWWYHDLDCFQLCPIDGSEIDLEGRLAGFIDEDSSDKFDTSSIFFRKGSHKLFEWIRNRAIRLNADEAIALKSLADTNYRNINSIYKKLKLVKMFKHL